MKPIEPRMSVTRLSRYCYLFKLCDVLEPECRDRDGSQPEHVSIEFCQISLCVLRNSDFDRYRLRHLVYERAAGSNVFSIA